MIGQQIDQYKVDALIGKGLLGTVYQATDLNLHRLSALKFIHPQYTNQPQYHAQILQQAKKASRLTHSSIATIYNFDHKDDLLFLSSEHVQGKNLALILKQLGQQRQMIRLDEILILLSQVADALSYAHQHGMLHQNLKPSNIIVKPLDSPRQDGTSFPFRAVLTDFGMTRLLSGDVKSANMPLFDVLPYMPPEQCLGTDSEAGSDIYSLGIILYQLTTGHLPFKIETATEAMIMHSLETARPPRLHRAGIPNIVEEIITRCLEKQIAHRYPDMGQLADALRQAAEGMTDAHLQAFPPGTVVPLSSLNLISQKSNPVRTYLKPIDSRLPIPEDDLIALLQANLQGDPHAVFAEDSSIHEVTSDRILDEILLNEVATFDGATKGTRKLTENNGGSQREKRLKGERLSSNHRTPIISHSRNPVTQTSSILIAPRPVEQLNQIDKVLITRSGRAPRTVNLEGDTLCIGRSRDNDIVLATPDVSRHHAQLQKGEQGGWKLVDLNSSGGTYWGGHKLLPNVPEAWNQNQILRIGPYTLRWQSAQSRLPHAAEENNDDQVTELHQVPKEGVQTSSRNGQFSLMVTPTILAIAPGKQATVQVELFNQGITDDLFTLRLVDLSPEMVLLSQNSVHLAPGSRATLPVTLEVPLESRIQAGHHPYQIIVHGERDRTETAVISARVTVAQLDKFSVTAWPLEVTNGGECQVLIHNQGNVGNRFSLTGQAVDATIRFGGEQGHVRLEPGQSATMAMSVMTDKRPFLGRNHHHPFELRVRNSTGRTEIQAAQLELKPIIPSWALPVLEIILVILLSSFALSRFFGNSDDHLQTNTPVNALQEDFADSSTVANNLPPTLVPLLEEPEETAVLSASGDDDGDGVENEDETNYGTDPLNPDSDEDGLLDGEEIFDYLTSPIHSDSDLDGVSDGEEINLGTDPLRFPLKSATPDPNQSNQPVAPAPTDVPAESPIQPTPTEEDNASGESPAPAATAVSTQPPATTEKITVQLTLLTDGTGWVTESGDVHLGIDTPIQAGDLATNEPVRGFLSYDLNPLPTNAILQSARLTFSPSDPDSGIEGDPFNDLDCLALEAVEFDPPLDGADYDAVAFYIDCEVGRPATVDILIDVQDALDFNLPHLQIRFGFDIDSDNDNANDLYFLRVAPVLEITYSSP